MQRITGPVFLVGVVFLLTCMQMGRSDVIYSQARRHDDPGTVYMAPSCGSGSIFGQNFNPWFDGKVEEIAIGGCWTAPSGEHLIVEMWRPAAPGRKPVERLRQWDVFSGDLRLEEDAEGFPLYVFRTDDCGDTISVRRGEQYVLVAYLSRGSEVTQWGWTYDMASSGNLAKFWVSTDRGVSWHEPSPPPPAPEYGNPAWNFEFELRGFIANDNIETIYDQTRSHRLTGGTSWYVKSYAGTVSAIYAQGFSPRCSGRIQRITIGARFPSIVPSNVVFEVWRPIAPGRYPAAPMLKQWTIPSALLISGTDAEGQPTLTADVSGDPLDVVTGLDYVFAAYSDGNYMAPLDWASDMTTGQGWYWLSTNRGGTWSGPNWFGAPENPSGHNPVANLEFRLEGPTGERVEISSPSTQLLAGWNWIAFPCILDGDRDPADVLGPQVENRLFAWDDILKTILLYPSDFRQARLGEGYVLWQDERECATAAGWAGAPATREVPVPMAGVAWIGVPGNFEIPLEAVYVRDDIAGEVRTAREDSTACDPWLDWNWVYWDAVERTARICSFAGGDAAVLWPWHGYRIFALRESLTLIVIAPENP